MFTDSTSFFIFIHRLKQFKPNFSDVVPRVMEQVSTVLVISKKAFIHHKPQSIWIPPIPTKMLTNEGEKSFIPTVDTYQRLVVQQDIGYVQYDVPWHNYFKQYFDENAFSLTPKGKCLKHEVLKINYLK